MKKIFLLLAAACVTLSAAADEGMWMLPYLQKMNSKDMKARGCKLSAEEIYSMNNSSLKDAIVIFGGGCTGEIVSPDGLLFTNHHCGYGSIQSLSSVEHDYLKNGFWAMSRAEELPAPGLKVRFIRRIVDVTPDVLGAVPDIAGGGEREELVAGQVKAVSERLAGENPGMDVEIKSFFGGNQYFAFVIEVFRDVRLVGAPPTSIGKFGGDTDNWMWPRHTGDFSVFRVYAGPDNRPADYSLENRPYKAEKFLKISLGGYDEGDFAMIMGFPGSTQRYMTSYEIDRLLEVENPQRIFIRGERQAILKEDMAASAKVRIQYASKYAQSSNYWKNSIGKSRGIRRLDVKGRKQEQEAAFTAWAAKNTLPTEGYSNALNLIRESVEETAPYFASSQYLSEAIGRSVEILAPARLAVSKKGGELTEALKAFYKDRPARGEADVPDRRGELQGAAFGVRRGDRQAVRRRYGRLCGLSLRQFGVRRRAEGAGCGRRRNGRFERSRRAAEQILYGENAGTGGGAAGREAEIRRRTAALHCGADAHAAEQGLGFGRQFHTPSDLWARAALRSGRRHSL